MAMQKFNPTQSNPWGLMAQDGSRVCVRVLGYFTFCAWRGRGRGRNEKGLGLPRWTPRLPFTYPHDPKGPQAARSTPTVDSRAFTPWMVDLARAWPAVGAFGQPGRLGPAAQKMRGRGGGGLASGWLRLISTRGVDEIN